MKKKGRGLGESASIAKSKSKQLKVENVPFNIQIDCIGASLQLQNFDFIYQQLYSKQFKRTHSSNKQLNQDNKVSDAEFHAALQYLTQLLYIIRDMASSADEKNKKNAKILQTNVFYKDLCVISRMAFKMYNPAQHNKQFLYDVIEFNHLMLEMLDEYSKGKILMIQTQKKRRVKKSVQRSKK
jgi:hypothetical protein